MRKSFSIFQAGLFLALTVLIPDFNYPQSFIQNPLHECYFLKTETIKDSVVASDNVNVLYLPLPEGLVRAVEGESLKTIWQSDVGGEINGSVVYNGALLFIATTKSITATSKNETANETAAEKNTPRKNFRLQALSAGTGITQWSKEIAFSGDAKRIYMLLSNSGNDLYALSDNGTLLILDTKSGTEKTHKEFNRTVNFPLLTLAGEIYFGTAENKIFAISNLQGEPVVTQIADLESQPTALFSDNGAYIFAGDKSGFIYGIQLSGKRVKWKSRSGGEITSIKQSANNLIVSSSDNYIYFLTKNNGRRIWKKRLEGKIQGEPAVTDDFTIVSPLGTNTATVIDLKKGKTVNLVPVGDSTENSFINAPLLLGNNVIFSTVAGFYSFSADKCANVH